MNSVFIRLAVVCFAVVNLVVPGAFADSPSTCNNASWDVSAHKMGQILHVTLREKTQQGALCDLVVGQMSYNAADSQLSVQVSPTDFCAVDAFGHRTATVMWNLPQNLRGDGTLTLLVNGIGVGQLHLDSRGARFTGGCL